MFLEEVMSEEEKKGENVAITERNKEKDEECSGLNRMVDFSEGWVQAARNGFEF